MEALLVAFGAAGGVDDVWVLKGRLIFYGFGRTSLVALGKRNTDGENCVEYDLPSL